MEWGDSVYTVLPLPDDISDALAALGAKRVEGEINDHPVNLAITKAPVLAQRFVYTGKSQLRAAGIEPGAPLEVRLRPADPNVVILPPDLDAALRAADLSAAWAALTPGKRRGLLHSVETAKRPETRAKRSAAVCDGLR